MSALAELEIAVRERRDFSRFDNAYLHRAWRENAIVLVRGRDRIRQLAVAEAADAPAGPLTIEKDLREGASAMIAFATAGGWRGHRWANYEGSWIHGDIEVVDGAARARIIGRGIENEARRLGALLPAHAPLGELASGRGQLGAPERVPLPPGFPAEAEAAAAYLHRIWNWRDLAGLCRNWTGPSEAASPADFVLGIHALLPDAVLIIEQAIVDGDATAVLWRLHGHHLGHGWGAPTGRRIRMIGSSVLTLQDGAVVREDLLLDTLAARATLHRPLISYVDHPPR